ncbi:copper chaperone PCu(A)C [Roseovarius salinarum]|jgi:hypothetical protein|uniref:copper chaperone PCu(A)C n=1 Tax=Roseovarius salinarum TaxID=1981892 RepID=UPI000C3438D1|nr:copper chaperone PCu(A)C [Roseovarius salinarum]
MSIKSTLLAGIAALSLAAPALAGNIEVKDPYARSAAMSAMSGAAFMMIHNTGETDDRLVGAASPVAEKVELHTHKEDDMGVMRMIHVEEGFPLPAGGKIAMKRGGRHVMFMGLKAPFEQGDTVPLTLTFETAGEMSVEVPVDLERQPMEGHGHDMGD